MLTYAHVCSRFLTYAVPVAAGGGSAESWPGGLTRLWRGGAGACAGAPAVAPKQSHQPRNLTYSKHLSGPCVSLLEGLVTSCMCLSPRGACTDLTQVPCVCVCVFVCLMCVCLRVCVYVCMYVHTYVMYVCMYIRMWCLYVCGVCMYVWMFGCLDVCIYVCMYVAYVCIYVMSI